MEILAGALLAGDTSHGHHVNPWYMLAVLIPLGCIYGYLAIWAFMKRRGDRRS